MSIMLKGIISNEFNKVNDLVDQAKNQIKEVYLSDNKPWVVGYSGGKDSTVVCQLVFEALKDLPKEQLHKKVYVISSDTLVETPLIIQSINNTLSRMQEEALRLDIPLETHKVKPSPSQSFWANIIGRGYPSPNQSFRWCTDRMKIDPANEFIKDKVSKFGEVIMILGVRDSESATRANVMRSHTIEGKTLMRHSTLTNAFVFAPIRDFDLDDVWNYLLNNQSPWGDDNNELYQLYRDSNSNECPLVVDQSIKQSAGSCGNSRFGCWVCTVVSEDKALQGFINTGSYWLNDLRSFRDWLADIRDDRTLRMKHRMNGQIYFKKRKIEIKDKKKYVVIPKKGRRNEDLFIPIENFTIVRKGNLKEYIQNNNMDLSASKDDKLLIVLEPGRYAQLGLGPYTFEARKLILEELLKLQKKIKNPDNPNYEVITEEELKEIRRIWREQGEIKDNLPEIYRNIVGNDLDWEYDDQPLFDNDQLSDLEYLCQSLDIDFKLIKKLITLEKNYSGYKIRRGIGNELIKLLKQDYLHL